MGIIDKELIVQWKETLKTRTPDEHGVAQPVCPYNANNLIWSRRLIVDLILLDLWNEFKKEMSHNISGPMAFVTIIQHQQ